MKKLLAVLAAMIILAGSVCLAEDLSALTDGELLALYSNVLEETESRKAAGTAGTGLPDAEEAAAGNTAEEDGIAWDRLFEFLLSWQQDEKDGMLERCTPDWLDRQENPEQELFIILANRTLLDFTIQELYIGGGIENVPAGTVWTGKVDALIDRNNGMEAQLYRFDIQVKKADDGLWYVDPTGLNAGEKPGTTPEPSPDPLPVEANTAENGEIVRQLMSFFSFWNSNDLNRMLEMCTPAWKAGTEEPKVTLFAILGNRTPLSFTATDITGEGADRTVKAEVLADRNDGRDPVNYLFTIRMARGDDGQWYVDPEGLNTAEILPNTDPELPADGETAETVDFLLKVYDKSGIGKISYLRIDWYGPGGVWQGYALSCPDEGEDFYRFPITARKTGDPAKVELLVSYGVSDLSPEEAILRTMSGEPADEYPLLTTEITAENGETYSMDLKPAGWELVPAEEAQAAPAADVAALPDSGLAELCRAIETEMENRGLAGGGTDAAADVRSEIADRMLTERLSAFFAAWNDMDLDGMLDLCAPAWTEGKENPKTELFVILANRRPLSFETELVYGNPEDEIRTVQVITEIDRNNGREPAKYLLNVRMKMEGGLWYVDPASLNPAETADNGPVISEPTPEPLPAETGDTHLYYVSNGGEKYHADQNCPAVNPKYTPMEEYFTLADLNDGAHPELNPCNICGAPQRESR